MGTELHAMQSMGLLRIYGESLKLTFKLRKIFAQITLTFILPLAITFLAQGYVLTNLGKLLSFVLLEILSSVLALAFALLSISSVVYSIACFDASREITYRSVVTAVIPKVWKRLAVTLFCAFFAIVASVVSAGLTFLWEKMFDRRDKISVLGVFVLIGYAVLILSTGMVGQMASVVSVMEDANAVEAALKTGRLMRGNLVVGAIVSVIHVVALVGVWGVFTILTMRGWYGWDEYRASDVWKAVGYGCSLALLMATVILIGLVVQTTFYVVCKSYHGEKIDVTVVEDRPEVIHLGRSGAGATAGVEVQMVSERS